MTSCRLLTDARRISLALACFYVPYVLAMVLAPFRSELLICLPIIPGMTILHILDWWPDGTVNWATGPTLVLWGAFVTLVLLGAAVTLAECWRTRHRYVLTATALASSALAYPAYLLMVA
jgi:hypothetical protein